MFKDLRFIGRTVSLDIADPLVEVGKAVSVNGAGDVVQNTGPLFGKVLQVSGDKATVQFDGVLVVPFTGLAPMAGTIRGFSVEDGVARIDDTNGRRCLVLRISPGEIALLPGA